MKRQKVKVLYFAKNQCLLQVCIGEIIQLLTYKKDEFDIIMPIKIVWEQSFGKSGIFRTNTKKAIRVGYFKSKRAGRNTPRR
jgi:hypothetical protein